MRAGRLLTMISVLRQSGRLSASQLAERLEVSPRTVLRDVEALSEAGVPIYAVQGGGGGIELLDTFRSELAALTADDAPGLLLAGCPSVAAALGLTAAASSARRTLLAALPARLASVAEDVDRWFLDVVPDDRVPAAVTTAAAAALRLGVSLALDRGGAATVTVHPLGLVRDGAQWCLVHLADHGPEAMSLHDVRAARIVQVPVERPPGFDLHAFWHRPASGFTARAEATLRRR